VFDEELGEMVTKTASIDGSVDVSDDGRNYVLGSFDISEYDISPDTLLKLTVKSVVSGELQLPVNASSTFRFGR